MGRKSLFEFRKLPVPEYAKKGTTRYEVLRDGKVIGEVTRSRDRYPYKNLAGNTALFRSRWSWRNNRESRSFDTRERAVKSLVEWIEDGR